MKKTFFIYSLCLAGLLAASCSQEETAGTTTFRNIKVNVSDAGMINEHGNSRATTEGVSTTFDNGDEIGVYAVSNGTVVPGYDNLKLTKSAEGWNGFPEGATFPADTRFYAYYPYTASPAFSVDNTFSDLIKNWNPVTAASYTAGDLMTTLAPATLTKTDDLNATIDLQLSHAMSMIEVTVKSGETVTYDFTNEGLADYTVTTGGGEPSFTFGGTTYTSTGAVGTNTYRLLVNPQISGTLSVSVDGKNYAPKEDLSVQAGTYYTMTVGNSKGETTESYTLQVGDYFLSDGKLVSRDATLTEEQKALVAGVVYYVGDPTPTALYGSSYADYTDALKIEHPSSVHGLVYAVDGLDMAGSWGTEMASDAFLNLYQQSKGILAECSSSNVGSKNHRILGYDNTATFRYLNKSDATVYSQMLESLAARTDAPARTSGWFIPSYGDMYEIISETNAAVIAGSFSNTGRTLWEPGKIYMTSSPYFDSKKKYQKKMYGYDGTSLNTYKLDETPHVLRPALAF